MSNARFGKAAYPGLREYVVYDPDHEKIDGRVGDAFRSFVQNELSGSAAELMKPTEEDVSAVRAGYTLLLDVLPELGGDCVRHIATVALADSGAAFLSTTLADLSGVVIIDRRVLADPALIAESILHESLHSKLDALSKAHTLTFSAPGDNTTTPILAVWHPSGARSSWWSPWRALAACHFYAHLTVLGDGLRRTHGHADYGRRLKDRALFRAHYLGRELLRVRPAVLTETGAEMVD
ncbi:hypothetical protein [Amycolatopsis pigmentata]|uniref:HEXXH motif-containing protein n=1 Tax=Amycolatopsis pigmentata TaxID=450801 RepID=A0ABW5FP32_9PSEU